MEIIWKIFIPNFRTFWNLYCTFSDGYLRNFKNRTESRELQRKCTAKIIFPLRRKMCEYRVLPRSKIFCTRVQYGETKDERRCAVRDLPARDNNTLLFSKINHKGFANKKKKTISTVFKNDLTARRGKIVAFRPTDRIHIVRYFFY